MFESAGTGGGIVADISSLKARIANLEDEVLRLRRTCQQAYERAARAEIRLEQALTEWSKNFTS